MFTLYMISVAVLLPIACNLDLNQNTFDTYMDVTCCITTVLSRKATVSSVVLSNSQNRHTFTYKSRVAVVIMKCSNVFYRATKSANRGGLSGWMERQNMSMGDIITMWLVL